MVLTYSLSMKSALEGFHCIARTYFNERPSQIELRMATVAYFQSGASSSSEVRNFFTDGYFKVVLCRRA